jgi:hypothetical protein
MALKQESDPSFYCEYKEGPVYIEPTSTQLKALYSGAKVRISCRPSGARITITSLGYSADTIDFCATCDGCNNRKAFTRELPLGLQTVVNESTFCLKEENRLPVRISKLDSVRLADRWSDSKSVQCPDSGRPIRVRKQDDEIRARRWYELHCRKCGAKPLFPSNNSDLNSEDDFDLDR